MYRQWEEDKFAIENLFIMQKWCLLSIVLLFALPSFVFSQKQMGAIKGTVHTNDNKPAGNISIVIEEIQKRSTTNDNGEFLISRLTPGMYTIRIEAIGLDPQRQEISVTASKTTEENFMINIPSQRLEDVTVSTQQGKYRAVISTDVAKMPLKNMENPQVYTTVTGALLKDQQIVNYADALKNVPGVMMQLQNAAGGGTVVSRGFSTVSYLRNGVAGIASLGSIDMSNIESIEAIKGPSGTLYGSSLVSFGGLFNIITKKPFDIFKGEAAYTWGGYGLSRFTVDVNTPLNAEKTLLFRFDGALHHEDSWQDAGFASYEFAAPSLTYKISDKTTLELEGEYQNQRSNGFYRLFADGSLKTGVRSPKDLDIDWRDRFVGNSMAAHSTQAKLFTTLTHRFSKQWTSRTNFTYLSGSNLQPWAYMIVMPGNDSIIRYANVQNSKQYTRDLQENINGDFHIGSMRNRILFGVEVYSIETKSAGSKYFAFDTVSLSNPGEEYNALNYTALQNRINDNPVFSVSDQTSNTYCKLWGM